jgi:hypothetical protein
VKLRRRGVSQQPGYETFEPLLFRLYGAVALALGADRETADDVARRIMDKYGDKPVSDENTDALLVDIFLWAERA